MADQFTYVAISPEGRRVRGRIAARDEPTAFDLLRRDGLSPLRLTASRAVAVKEAKPKSLADREAADFLSSLADLLKARADIRTALGILGDRFERPQVKLVCQTLLEEIGGGESLERAFAGSFQGRQAFVAPMVAAGEAAGDLPGGLQRGAEVIYSRLKLRDQLVSVLAYPGFVFASAIGAVFVILLFIVPSIAPLAEETGSNPPIALSVMIAASDFLRNNLILLGLGLGTLVAALIVAGQVGVLAAPLERLFLDGPARRTVSGLVFGGFAQSLGTMLAAGAPIGDAIRLALRSVSSAGAKRRLEPIAYAVRQGQSLSDALSTVRGFPASIVRLAAVGEASNAVGELLMRGGKLEEDAALRRIETLGRIAGPALIVFLGALLGVLMGGLLSGVSSMGQSALG
ncbi:type II secretion system F family protein [Phenylobacterium sp.]|uniref:type II secretion system F family protein n=1 Tax=Phenylobacterium sp. TaxID=1871053 RepID=UPI0030F3E5EB